MEKDTLIIMLFFFYYFAIGLLLLLYFRIIRKKMKETWILYVFCWGMRVRTAISGVLSILTTELCIYGYIPIINN